MGLVFHCESCGARFDLDAKMAGRAGRCKACGRRMVIPPASEWQPAGGDGTARASAGRKPSAQPDGGLATGWIQAMASQVALKPLTIERFPALRREPASRSRYEDPVDATPGPYALAGSLTDIPILAQKSKAAGAAKIAYRHQVTNFQRFLRWLSGSAYLLSTPFIMVILVGIVARSRPLALAGATVVIVLNLARLLFAMSQMAVVPFQDGPIHGILFFIPPLTLYYLARHWKALKRSALRLVEPAGTILLVVLAFLFIPALSAGDAGRTSASERLLGKGGKLDRKVQEERDKAKALEESQKHP